MEQGDVFAAIRIFYWLQDEVQGGTSDADALAYIRAMTDNMNGSYPNRSRVLLYAYGLIKGIKNWAVTSDLFDGDVEAIQRIGKALYAAKVLGNGVPDDVKNSSALKPRYDRAATVWNHYHRIYGENEPLKRCRTGYKEWDINFEGVAHYGLIPDLLQDLSNVGMDHRDMSVLFKSSEHVAQMWTKTLDAASECTKPRVRILQRASGPGYVLDWFAEDGDELEETSNLNAPDSWRPFVGEVRFEKGRKQADLTPGHEGQRFYRVKRRQ
jgi:hypothetical protein